MHDGWFRITHPKGTVRVVHVYQNNSEAGSVKLLLERGYVFEEVLVMNKAELNHHVEDILAKVFEYAGS